jgi:3D-(3,5/4)-trihydroxycyclohexane-1,2-dione acylhydrolase (decyclizing)
MGFAASALMSGAAASAPRYALAFCGDGSFMMNPQVLIDAIEHKVHGTIVLFDNRRMAAISSLQEAQYQADYRTSDSVAVDYVQLASSVAGVLALHGGNRPEDLVSALQRARAHPGLSFVYVQVYYGPDPLGGMGAYGRWNVGNWVDGVESTYRNTAI